MTEPASEAPRGALGYHSCDVRKKHVQTNIPFTKNKSTQYKQSKDIPTTPEVPSGINQHEAAALTEQSTDYNILATNVVSDLSNSTVQLCGTHQTPEDQKSRRQEEIGKFTLCAESVDLLKQYFQRDKGLNLEPLPLETYEDDVT